MRKNRILIAAAAVTGWSATAAWAPAWGQGPRFKPANLEVFDAPRIVVELPGHRFKYGKALKLNFKPAVFPAQRRPRLLSGYFGWGRTRHFRRKWARSTIASSIARRCGSMPLTARSA